MRIRTHTNPLNFHQEIIPSNYNDIIEKLPSRIDVEIGFGRGVFIRNYAKQHTNRTILGIEVRKQMVALLQERLTANAITNAHLIWGNGEHIINGLIQPQQIENLFIFHPDPWFKKKHHKRRVITDQFISIIKEKLAPNGSIHISTDVSELFDDMCEKLASADWLIPKYNHPFWTNSYQTHWDSFSERDNRKTHAATYMVQT